MEAIGIDPGVLLSQVVNITILALGLYFLLFRRVGGMLAERRAKIEQGLQDAERAQARAAQAEAVYAERIEAAERERETILAQAKEEADKIKAEAKKQAQAEAREESQRVLAQEKEAFQTEREQALADMHDQVVSLVLAATRKVIEESLDEKMQRKLIDKFLNEVGTADSIQ